MQGLLRKIFIPFGSSSAPTVLKAQAKIILIFNFNYAIMYKGQNFYFTKEHTYETQKTFMFPLGPYLFGIIVWL
jgi:hypothetical protein